MFGGLCFWVSWPPLLLLMGRNFLNSNPFFMILNAPNAPIGGVQVMFGHQKQYSPPLGFSLAWALKCSVIGQFTLMPHIILCIIEISWLPSPSRCLSLYFEPKNLEELGCVYTFGSNCLCSKLQGAYCKNFGVI